MECELRIQCFLQLFVGREGEGGEEEERRRGGKKSRVEVSSEGSLQRDRKMGCVSVGKLADESESESESE